MMQYLMPQTQLGNVHLTVIKGFVNWRVLIFVNSNQVKQEKRKKEVVWKMYYYETRKTEMKCRSVNYFLNALKYSRRIALVYENGAPLAGVLKNVWITLMFIS